MDASHKILGSILDVKRFVQFKYRCPENWVHIRVSRINAVAENFFSCLKCELVHHKHYRTRSKAQADIFAYIEAYYNSMRPQSALNWLSPVEYEHLLSIYAAKVA